MYHLFNHFLELTNDLLYVPRLVSPKFKRVENPFFFLGIRNKERNSSCRISKQKNKRKEDNMGKHIGHTALKIEGRQHGGTPPHIWPPKYVSKKGMRNTPSPRTVSSSTYERASRDLPSLKPPLSPFHYFNIHPKMELRFRTCSINYHIFQKY